MSETDAVLFANEAFYFAFAGRDLKEMAAVWAEDAEVSCIHPGWDAIHGREEVMQSWHAILRGAGAPEILCHTPRVTFYGELASVICYEEIAGGYLLATNLFVRERGRWRMVHHQAAPTHGEPPESDDDEDFIPDKIN